MNTKLCKRCYQELDIAEFGPDKRTLDGRTSWCRKCNKEYLRNWYKGRPDRREKRKKAVTAWFAKNMGKFRANCKGKYKDKIRVREQEYRKLPYVKLAKSIRTAMCHYLFSSNRSGKCFRVLGYTQDELRLHLEKQFKPGMTWDNYGRGPDDWQIDHILPLSKFPALSADDDNFKKVWALSNLQPLWKRDNLHKSDKIL